MKKLAIAMMMGIAAMSASAQVNYKMQVACNPQDVKTYNTNRLRSSFLMEKVMVPDQINVTYSMYDRLIFGGAVPATKELVLETIDPLKAKYFLERRELGVINIGGEGIVTVDGKEYTLNFKDALYVGRGKQKVTFKSKDASKPAKFYINSATAHKEYKTQLITIDGRKGSLKANSFAAGKMEESNDRVINQLIVNNVLEEGPCQASWKMTRSACTSGMRFPGWAMAPFLLRIVFFGRVALSSSSLTRRNTGLLSLGHNAALRYQ